MSIPFPTQRTKIFSWPLWFGGRRGVRPLPPLQSFPYIPVSCPSNTTSASGNIKGDACFVSLCLRGTPSSLLPEQFSGFPHQPACPPVCLELSKTVQSVFFLLQIQLLARKSFLPLEEQYFRSWSPYTCLSALPRNLGRPFSYLWPCLQVVVSQISNFLNWATTFPTSHSILIWAICGTGGRGRNVSQKEETAFKPSERTKFSAKNTCKVKYMPSDSPHVDERRVI